MFIKLCRFFPEKHTKRMVFANAI